MKYAIEEVTNERQANEFLLTPVKLYGRDRNFVRPLDDDIRKVFDPARNPYFTHGECARWLLRDERGALAGRVAAFIDENLCRADEYAVGGMGFFECVDDREAAFALFDRCREWLQERGMEAMEGPENFGERNDWWGLLVEGFEPANYGMPYNPPYYRELFEAYGFRDYFQQYTYLTRLLKENLSKIVVWKSERLLKNGAYKLCAFRDISSRRAKEAFLEVYNNAWLADLHGVGEMDMAQVEILFKNLRPVIDPELIYFAFHEERPIGFFIMIPELNYILRHLNGKTSGWNALKFLYYRHVNRGDVALGLIFGVVSEFQGRGVEAAMIKFFCDRVVERGSHYKWLQMSWVGDFNKAQMHLMEYIGGVKCKTHVTYRKLFRDDIVFRRSVEKVKV
jgi:GNAT superfamily N-acetyltransferase